MIRVLALVTDGVGRTDDPILNCGIGLALAVATTVDSVIAFMAVVTGVGTDVTESWIGDG